MSYPEVIEVNGVEYEINTDYTYALACFACINDPDICDIERAYGVVGILYEEPPEDVQEALRMAIKYLLCGKEPSKSYKKADMDYIYDESYIKSSFMSDYKIDLDETYMHWWKFNNLLQGLTDDCILNRVRDLRNYDLSTIKDSKTRQKIIEAQRDVALPDRIAQEQQDIIDDFFSQLS